MGRWRDHGGVAFIDLRDASGVCQVVVRDDACRLRCPRPRNEFCRPRSSAWSSRPDGNANPDLLHQGDRGGHQASLALNPSVAAVPDRRARAWAKRRACATATRPAPSRPGQGDPPAPQVNAAARRVLGARDFVEIEIAHAHLPEGARLPRPPAGARQLVRLRYSRSCSAAHGGRHGAHYQIACCYRDEDFRGDRQPEFTQLDIEMSFVDQDDIIELGEALAKGDLEAIGIELTTPFPRITYTEAMDRYGPVRSALRPRDQRGHRLLRQHPVPRLPGAVRGAVVMPAMGKPAAGFASSTPAGVGQAARRQGVGLRDAGRVRRARRAGQQEHLGRRTCWPGRARGCQARRLHLLRGRP